jgi:hypothetical protein
VLVGRIIGLAVSQDDQGLAVALLPGELGDGIEARLIELSGQRDGLDGAHLPLEIALGGIEIGEQGQIVIEAVGGKAAVAVALLGNPDDRVGHLHQRRAPGRVQDLDQEHARERIAARIEGP